ncbi:MAG: CotH kinase family protein [Xanthomonadales bacterium]|nr:CotH kinase family protein [Xanthomonadales bacterium]
MRIEKYVRFGLLMLVLLAVSLTASAQTIYPEDGWWWNPEEPGRGYLMERQQDTIFVVSFHYSELGVPEWLMITGDFVPDAESELVIGTMTGEVLRVSDGQCIGCDYIPPVESISEQGTALLTFYSNQAATLDWPGESVDIERFFWSWADSLTQLEGDWILVTVPLEGDPTAIIAEISDTQSNMSITDNEGVELGSIDLDEGELLLSMNDMSEPLPILVPESKRFFAGSADGSSDVVMGLRVDDLPLVNLYEGSSDADFEATDWTDETHSKNVDPNFEEVFSDGTVKRLDFVVTPERWQSMLDNMTDMYGEFGEGSSFGGLLDDTEDPIFVPAEVFYNGKQWYRAGIRFKGNSSLQTSWQQGILKLSFKLDFDEFEDDYPQINNQRFYGFKKFSLKNNYDDKSLLREKVAAEVFANAGLAVSHTAFYTLYVDHGNGPEYFGLYTLVEEVDGPVIDTNFTSDDGNLYKPEGDGASFVENSFDEASFEKKTNEDEEDWSDILALFSALHSDSYNSNPTSWRAGLESVFDIDVFLKYLAVNQVIQNWDTYGKMTHNYYLYDNPENSRLTWIPWDNNEALQEGKMGGALRLDFSNIEAGQWPLIEKVYADDSYRAKYNEYVSQVINGAFETNTIQATYDNYAALVQPYAEAEIAGYTFINNPGEFTQAIAELKTHAASRAAAVESYLNGQ